MRILYLGTPTFAVRPLEALAEAGHEVVAVVTQPDRPAGRKRVLTPPPVKQAAQNLDIPILQPSRLRGEAIVEELAALQPEVGVVAAYGEILRKNVLDIPPLGYLNIHPSLLPRYRGPAPVVGAILAGDHETGVTIMKLDEGMDSGPIVAQTAVPLPPDARALAFTEELFQLGATLLVQTLAPYAAGQVALQPQDHEQATITRMLKKEDGLIDWSQPAEVIERMPRAYDPWPGAQTAWRGQPAKIIRAQARNDADLPDDAAPGTIMAVDSGPLVATGDGLLEVLEIQPAGKRVMTAREWLAGQRQVVGQAFVIQ